FSGNYDGRSATGASTSCPPNLYCFAGSLPLPLRGVKEAARLDGRAAVDCGQGGTRMYDLVIRGATVIDGLGRDPQRTDVAVKDGRVAALGALRPSFTATSVRCGSRPRPS